MELTVDPSQGVDFCKSLPPSLVSSKNPASVVKQFGIHGIDGQTASELMESTEFTVEEHFFN